MVGIIGSGFALYGYLPAICVFEDNVCLLNLSKEKIFARDELVPFINRVIWCRNIEELLKKCTRVIIVVNPRQQHNLIIQAIKHKNIKYFMLEKPISCNPASAKIILNYLSNLSYSICYLFLYTPWFKKLNTLQNEKFINFKIDWFFLAHHLVTNQKNWKSIHEEGGGVIRFYSIHLIAVLVKLGFNSILEVFMDKTNPDESTTLCLKVKNEIGNLAEINIKIASCTQLFRINVLNFKTLESRNIVNDLSPFGQSHFQTDNRIEFLKEYYIDSLKEEPLFCNQIFYSRVVSFWEKIENKLMLPIC